MSITHISVRYKELGVGTLKDLQNIATQIGNNRQRTKQKCHQKLLKVLPVTILCLDFKFMNLNVFPKKISQEG